MKSARVLTDRHSIDAAHEAPADIRRGPGSRAGPAPGGGTAVSSRREDGGGGRRMLPLSPGRRRRGFGERGSQRVHVEAALDDKRFPLQSPGPHSSADGKAAGRGCGRHLGLVLAARRCRARSPQRRRRHEHVGRRRAAVIDVAPGPQLLPEEEAAAPLLLPRDLLGRRRLPPRHRRSEVGRLRGRQPREQHRPCFCRDAASPWRLRRDDPGSS